MIGTVGHSNRTIDDLLAVLNDAGTEILVDVRARPSSKRNPQFNRCSLSEALECNGIHYQFHGRALGGMRKARSDSTHHALTGSAMQGYADHMGGTAFRTAATELMVLSQSAFIVVMCAERDPLNCHRSLLADWLFVHACQVIHLIAPRVHTRHSLHPQARVSDGCIIYDRNTQATLI